MSSESGQVYGQVSFCKYSSPGGNKLNEFTLLCLYLNINAEIFPSKHQDVKCEFLSFFLVFTGVRLPFTEGVLSGPTLSCCYMAVTASLESWRVLTVPVERMERYFGAVLHTDLVAGLHFMSVWWSTPSVSSPTAASSPNV